eukprot:8058-Heterococcus_DN1.PRE.1
MSLFGASKRSVFVRKMIHYGSTVNVMPVSTCTPCLQKCHASTHTLLVLLLQSTYGTAIATATAVLSLPPPYTIHTTAALLLLLQILLQQLLLLIPLLQQHRNFR